MKKDSNVLPNTAVKIIKILYFTENPKTSIELAEKLKNYGLNLDPRTIRYHLTSLQKLGLIEKIKRKGARLTQKGINYAKKLFVYDRFGAPSIEVENLLFGCNYDPNKNSGKVIVNATIIKKDKKEETIKILKRTSLNPKIIFSPLIGIIEGPNRFWNINVSDNEDAILCLSSRTLDAILIRNGILIESISTGLYHIEKNKPSGFTEIISHFATTLSPGELLIKGRYTNVIEVTEGGDGYITAATKTFPTAFYDKLLNIIKKLENLGFNGVLEHGAIIPEERRISIKDKYKGYIVVCGGANYLAPLIERGLATTLYIAAGLYPTTKMFKP